MEILVIVLVPFIMIYIIDKASGTNNFKGFIKYLFGYEK